MDRFLKQSAALAASRATRDSASASEVVVAGLPEVRRKQVGGVTSTGVPASVCESCFARHRRMHGVSPVARDAPAGARTGPSSPEDASAVVDLRARMLAAEQRAARAEQELVTARIQAQAAASPSAVQRNQDEHYVRTRDASNGPIPSIKDFRDACIAGKYAGDSDKKYLLELASAILLSSTVAQ